MKHSVDSDQLNQGYSWWLAELLFRHMKVLPSEFIRYIARGNPARNVEQTYIILLACFSEWGSILSNGNYSIGQDVKMISLEDLKREGQTVY